MHFNIVKPVSPESIAALNFDSFTSYVWIHHVAMSGFPESSYTQASKDYFKYADRAAKVFPIPYYPNVSVGWDSSPRCDPDSTFKVRGYPCTPILSENTPEAFKKSLQQAKAFLDNHPDSKNILTINSWNEWTEGSYLEPDVMYKFSYLKAIKQVYQSKKN
ncbi:glycoside hydrolase family 99-like domain-containing protein [Niabella ginsengisoli]|uniref:Glycoside hydrolase family 99-like domain-containing protein n=1 Tax=Niabella ginsengisoli TaxID=522298 RepID=A0ABS9SI72_9BACT|nr:glycoside hydrolase family 99-like domain-containing protein [Niabella ginsengisoli]MCH5598011.1 glycoside hydrolase family 99-like domain-containing protein [Niabella ginsengisoli]